MCAPFPGETQSKISDNEQRAVRRGQLGERQHLISSRMIVS